MTDRTTHLLSVVPIAILGLVVGYHPAYGLALVAGVLLPEIDTVSPSTHRSWLFHTFLPAAIVYDLAYVTGVGERFPAIPIAIHFLTLGMAFHFLLDYVYPRRQSNEGAEWPVRPALFSAPWGLMWFGLAWFAQWFGYLSFAFFPWLLTDFLAV